MNKAVIDSPTAIPPVRHPRHDRRWLALLVLCLGVLMIVLDTTIVNVALPSIKTDLKFSATTLAWVVNAYMLTYGGFLLLGGRLGDLYGHRRLFLIGIVVFTLASLGIGFVISAWSSSDSQAVQLSMLVLLMSIFFSGFFLPLENFWAPIRVVGYALPLTHAIDGFQDVMLRGRAPNEFTWLALGGLAALTFVCASLLSHWRFRRLD